MYRGSTNRFFELIRVHSPEVERHLDKHNLAKMLCGRLGLFKLFLQFRCEPAVVVGFVWGRPELCKETNGFILVESLAPLKSVRNLVRVFCRNRQSRSAESQSAPRTLTTLPPTISYGTSSDASVMSS